MFPTPSLPLKIPRVNMGHFNHEAFNNHHFTIQIIWIHIGYPWIISLLEAPVAPEAALALPAPGAARVAAAAIRCVRGAGTAAAVVSAWQRRPGSGSDGWCGVGVWMGGGSGW